MSDADKARGEQQELKRTLGLSDKVAQQLVASGVSSVSAIATMTGRDLKALVETIPLEKLPSLARTPLSRPR